MWTRCEKGNCKAGQALFTKSETSYVRYLHTGMQVVQHAKKTWHCNVLAIGGRSCDTCWYYQIAWFLPHAMMTQELLSISHLFINIQCEAVPHSATRQTSFSPLTPFRLRVSSAVCALSNRVAPSMTFCLFGFTTPSANSAGMISD